MTLDDIKIGKSCRVISLANTNDIKRRLLDIGLIEGTIVTAYLESTFKDPIAYKIKNAIIAIRKKDAKKVEVEEI